jgi:UDP-glucose 4-epimerase
MYFEEGDKNLAVLEDYTSGNTHRLTDEELEKLLLSLEYVRRELETPLVTFGGHA